MYSVVAEPSSTVMYDCVIIFSEVNYFVDVRLQTLQCGSAHWGPIDKSFFCKHSLPYLHGLCYMYIYNLITQHL